MARYEDFDDDYYSENYLKVKTNSNKTGEIVSVLITKRNENELVGEL